MINKKLVYIICSFTAIAIVGSIFSNNVMADDVNYDVNIAPSIMVSIPTDTVTLNLNPFVSAFGSTDLPVTVGTNNPTGYTLTMSPSDDTTTSLTRTGGTETIPTLDDLSGGYTEQTFTTNKWGYKLSSTNYLPFATSNEIAVTDAPSNATTSTVTFATKADTTLVSGAYNLEITFTAVANYVPPAPISACNTPVPGNYTYLQDINSSNKAAVLASLTEGSAYYLRDSRDEEPYCISKLADGNLWFLDNLRLDLTNSTILNAVTADNTNADVASIASLKSGNRSAGVQYASSGFATWNSSSTSNVFNQAKANADYKDTTTTSYGSGSGKIGVYYNYCAASAGSYCYEEGAGTGNASQDICPKGWRMPTGGSSGEYNTLYGKYNTTQDAANSASLQYNLSTPLSGSFNNGSASGQGDLGLGIFWSSVRVSNGSVYDLYVDSSYVNTLIGGSRKYGNSLRCLLQ